MSPRNSQTGVMLFSIRPSFGRMLEIELVTRENHGERQHWLVCEFPGEPAESWEVPLDPSILESLLAELEAVRIAPVPENVLGLDGTSFYFTVKRGFNRLSLSWWQELPQAWKPLNPLLRRLVSLAGEGASHVDVASLLTD